jgi:hypothetical protein
LPGFFEYPEKCQPYNFVETGCEAYSTEDGFPQVLDLSAYYANNDDGEPKPQPKKDMSIFATEYERLHGDLSKGLFMENLSWIITKAYFAMSVSMLAIPDQTADSQRFSPSFDALNPNLKSVFQNST